MLKNILKSTIRDIRTSPLHAFINLAGLVIGLVTSILIYTYVVYEENYDTFHKNYERVYRTQTYYKTPDFEGVWSATQGFIIPSFIDDFKEVESGVRFMQLTQLPVFTLDDKSFTESKFIYADTTFFQIFSYTFLEGDKEHAFSNTKSLVLTQSVAKRYFGEESALGKTLSSRGQEYVVSGVIMNPPSNSHLDFDMVASLEDLRSKWTTMDDAGPAVFYSYIKLKPSQDINDFSQIANREIYRLHGYTSSGDSSNIPEDIEIEWRFQRVDKVHLSGNFEKEFTLNSDIIYVRIFSIVAFLILILACINYTNLSTARSDRRSKEVTIRKILGAKKSSLFFQYIGEALLLTIVAGIISIILAVLLLPQFNELVGRTLQAHHFLMYGMPYKYTAIILLVGLLSGWYPALGLTNINPTRVLKGKVTRLSGKKGFIHLRRTLVIIQFSISIALIIGTLVIKQQINFISEKDVGFDKDGVLVLSLPSNLPITTWESFKNELANESSIENLSYSFGLPGKRLLILSYRVPGLGGSEPSEEAEDDGNRGIRTIFADSEIVQTLDFKIVAGRDFNKGQEDFNHSFILNEAAVKEFGIEDPIGHPFEYTYGLDTPKVGKVIGVVKDFHYASLKDKVDPVVIQLGPAMIEYLIIKYSNTDHQSIAETVKSKWEDMMVNLPFDYFFLDSFYNQIYSDEYQLGKIITYFTLLSILIASLGLFGMVSYLTEIRKKEVAIRKVLGSSLTSIIILFSKEYFILISIAFFIAAYPSYYFLEKWLNDFTFKLDLTFNSFFIAYIISVFIAAITVVSKLILIVNANPIDSIRNE